MGEREAEGQELPCRAEAESVRDARRRQATCSWRCSAAAGWHCQEKVLVTPFCSGRTGVQRNSVTEVRLRREWVAEQEPHPNLPFSVAHSQWCPLSLRVVLTLFTVWADANLMMLQDEK